jgi:hypothetical protein
MLTKEQFLKDMNILLTATVFEEALDNVFRNFSEERHDFICGAGFNDPQMVQAFVDTIEQAMNDQEHWVSWWIFDTNFGRERNMTQITADNGAIWNISTAAALWDFLIEQ